MELRVLDTDFSAIGVLDTFDSIIWTDRYYEAGDFEVYSIATKELLNLLKTDRYIWSRQSEHLMIVESVEIKSDSEGTDYATVTGRSLESILSRRIIWGQFAFNGTLKNCLKQLLDTTIVSPSDSNRKIDGFHYDLEVATSDTVIDVQYVGDNLYDIVVELCNNFQMGFKITLDPDNHFLFKVYKGEDRSYEQSKNSYITFSPEFDNVLTEDFSSDKRTLKTIAWVTGTGTYPSCATSTVESSGFENLTGLNRREMHVDASEVSDKYSNGSSIPAATYKKQIEEKAKTDLRDNGINKSFEGEIYDNGIFKYDREYFLGDIVDMHDDYGNSDRVRVIEYTYSQDKSGESFYPTFKSTSE